MGKVDIYDENLNASFVSIPYMGKVERMEGTEQQTYLVSIPYMGKVAWIIGEAYGIKEVSIPYMGKVEQYLVMHFDYISHILLCQQKPITYRPDY